MSNVGLGIARTIVDADGDVVTVTNNRLDVNIADASGSITIDNPNIDNIASNTEETKDHLASVIYADDADWTNGSSKHLLIGGLYQSSPQSITDGDVGPLQVDQNGKLLTYTSLAAGTNNIGDVDVLTTVYPAGHGTFTSYAQFDAAESPTALTHASNGINVTETAAKEVIIQADNDNSGYIMVGGSNAAADTNGIRLNAGDTLILPVANIANIYMEVQLLKK